MIHRTVPTWQTLTWQDELKQQIDTPEALLQWLNLEHKWLDAIEAGHKLFPIRVTPSFLAKIKPNDPHDPLLLQILPTLHELHPQETGDNGYSLDPLLEQQYMPCPGLIHKYRSRVLLIAANQCAINCRYCFRRHFPYQDNHLNREQWSQAFSYIAEDKHINEVILSGGDPLSLSDKQLAWFTTQISSIEHVKRLRIHTRYPIILPSRITSKLVNSVLHPRLKTVLVSHCNHPQEIDEQVKEAFHKLSKANILLLNQSVLLKNVNDNSKILCQLSEKLFESGVLPYYLHTLDKVRGAQHFALSDTLAKQIYRELMAALPGFLTPKLVKEEPHKEAKTPFGFL